MSKLIGAKVIIRGDRSGVFFGILESKEGREVTLTNCRRLWRWDGANSISELAKSGTKKAEGCKFTVVVDELVILDAIEIIACTNEAVKAIESVKAWMY